MQGACAVPCFCPTLYFCSLHLIFAPSSSEVAVGFLVFLYLVHKFAPAAHASNNIFSPFKFLCILLFEKMFVQVHGLQQSIPGPSPSWCDLCKTWSCHVESWKWTRQAAKLQETPLSSLLTAPSYLSLPSNGFPEHCREMRADTPSFHLPFSPTSFVLCPFLPTPEFQENATLNLENRIAGTAPRPTGMGPALGEAIHTGVVRMNPLYLGEAVTSSLGPLSLSGEVSASHTFTCMWITC